MDERTDAPPGPTTDRRLTLGASEISAVVGLNPYQGPVSVWAAKTDPNYVNDVPRMDLDGKIHPVDVGHALERAVLVDLYARPRGYLLDFPGTVVCEEEPWASATPDALVRGTPLGAECKIVGTRQMHRWSDDEAEGPEGIPTEVNCQAQWQAWVRKLAAVDVVALIGTEVRVYNVPRHEEMIAVLVAAGRDFWTRCVIGGQMPVQIDGSEATRRVLERHFGKESRGMLEPTPAVLATAIAYADSGGFVKQYEAEKKQAGNHLRALIGEAAGFEGEIDGRKLKVTWKEQAGRADWERRAEALADGIRSILDAPDHPAMEAAGHRARALLDAAPPTTNPSRVLRVNVK